ncbi:MULTISPECIES: hypothetical protein [unclassified Tolypothrix]|uniref:hypothetical protein n=1 Tax=unclassified Tolypothrix TaxID=2649714 RepID=UPI0005EAB900|nr:MULTISPECIES: hypothetical protein [unclassified Tolypothrix]BAY90123.1 hypothetical protein NIES3275_21330 [Microchaete diplosiphon NIES-3275]EKE97371.1 hypothetical protein FDUTEX481_05079 [Tolypothrix sp. PCC 7601]MBE9083029.1 hypothetical protein [Tolypothrix sp. LEGE 11397]UYD24338.1 hypothetical protein HGR01_23080 [Tolypothrix sp. PCC 7712]UYD33428.1 hypothetical protein HG267_31595 [Tolypothrix sp. PCC 7601]
MNSIFTPEEITALSAEIDRQLIELRSAPDSAQKQGEDKISDEKLLVKQTEVITQVTQENSRSFLQKFGRAAKSDLCQEGGMLNKQWQKWGDLDNKDAVERLGGVLVGMGFSGDVLSPLVVAITVIIIHIGLKAFCEDYSSEVDNK